MSETITHINRLMNTLYELAYWAHNIENERVPNDIIDYPEAINSVVRIADTVQEEAEALSALYPTNLHSYFQQVQNAAKGIKQLVTEFDPAYLRWPICKLSEDVSHLLEDLWKMNSALAEHVTTTMSLSGLSANSLTPDFVSQNPQAAIQYAFTILEDRLRRRIGARPDVYGEALINEAFGNRGRLTYGATQAEDNGVRNLIAGAYATFRNPRMHRIMGNDDQMVSTILTLVDLLTQLVDDARDKSPTTS